MVGMLKYQENNSITSVVHNNIHKFKKKKLKCELIIILIVGKWNFPK